MYTQRIIAVQTSIILITFTRITGLEGIEQPKCKTTNIWSTFNQTMAKLWNEMPDNVSDLFDIDTELFGHTVRHIDG